MFNITILDVAIGLIFIYLLLSLMCSVASEIIELLLKKRAIDLERGIRELLVPGSPSGSQDIVQKLYNHSLINGLFGGSYEDSRIATRARWVARTALPSYIPARNFALALMDLILPGETKDGATERRSGTAGATAPSASPVSTPQVVVNVPGNASPVVVPPAAAPSPNSLAALRSNILALDSEQIQQALIPLLDAAGNDVTKVRENIEGWYNASMDRVSSWYKRRSQVTILILGLFVAVTVNVDTITIVKRLSTDKALRESLVAASDAYAKANANVPASPAAEHSLEPSAKPSESAAPAPNGPAGSVASAPAKPVTAASPSPSAAATASPAKTASAALAESSPSLKSPSACVEDENSLECERAKELQKACIDPNSPKCKYENNLRQIQALGLPIGWDSTRDPRSTWPGWHWKRNGGWWDQIYWHGFGWLLTALALSLGAPFWFDLLNKFIVIRSAVKPHEKSPEEESKD